MVIEELLKESTIEFPRYLSLEETNELLDYIAINLPALIDTETEIHCTRRYNEENKEFQKTQETIHIYGRIRDNNSLNSDRFITKSYLLDNSKILGINFQTISGELEEHRPEVRQLWADVRKQIENYFSEKVI